MKPDDLATAGRALYGDRWQTSLAHDLHVSDRTMRRWLAGDSPIPRQIENEVRAVLAERLAEISGMIDYDTAPAEHMIRHDRSTAALREDSAGNFAPATVPAAQLHGFLRGSVVVPPEIDLTDPVTEDAFAAQEGKIHN